MKPDFASIYSSKTDDELLALAVDRASLEPEAQTVLWGELKRRKLTDPHFRLRSDHYEVPFREQNLAFNTPAKVAFVVMFLGVASLGLTIAIAASQVHALLNLVLVCVLFWGPIFATIAWATRRALRNRPSDAVRNQKR